MQTNKAKKTLNPWQFAAITVIVLAVVTNIVWIRVNKAPPRMYDDALYHAESIHL